MKRLLLLISLFVGFFAQAQDTKPVDANNKSLQSSINVTWWYNIVNHKIGMWKGGTYIYNEFFSAKQVQAKIDSLAYVKTDSVTGTSPIVVTKTSQKVFNVSINPADCDNPGSISAADQCFLDSLHLIGIVPYPGMDGSTWSGGWDANSNTPTLSNATGTLGYYYNVTVSGTVDFGAGAISFQAWEYDVWYNGTVWVKRAHAFLGIRCLNGQFGWYQSFATGTAGTAPAFGSTMDTHTLNIPYASKPGVTLGGISHAEYDSIANCWNKQEITPADTTRYGTLQDLSGFVTSVTGTAPISSSGGTTPDISINPASCSEDGYMLHTDKCFLDSLHLKGNVLKGDSALIKTTTGDSITITALNYGALYNWYAATDARNIAPVGFHVPSDAEWATLIAYLGDESIVGGKLKETLYTYWSSPNEGATNEIGFNAKGAGQRYIGEFVRINEIVQWWSSTAASSSVSFYREVSSANAAINYDGDGNDNGRCIRFIADSGTPTTAVGNNGIIYSTVTIGSQTWTAENSNETKYQNGDYIHGYEGGVYTPISNATWTALTTEGMCYYANNTINGGITTKVPVFINVFAGDTIQIPNITNLATKDTLQNYWNKQEITEADTTRWSLGYAAYLWGNHASAGYLTGLTVDSPLSGLGTAASPLTVDLSSKENAFSKNTGFNLNLGTTSGTVLEGRSFGTAAASATGDFAPASVYPATGLTENYLVKKGATTVVNSQIYDNGINVGIRTTNPGGTLDVNGRMRAKSLLVDTTVHTFTDLVNDSPWYGIGISNLVIAPQTTNYAVQVAGYYGLSFQTSAGQIVMNSTGNVGIGYSSGTEITNNKFAANGTIYSSSTVDATGFKLSGITTFLNWTRTGYAGTAGQYLKSQGTGTTPIWTDFPSIPSTTLFTTVALSDETTDLTTGTAKRTFRMPVGCTITAVRLSVNTAPTGSTIIVDINESGTTILSTKLSIDASELTSITAASAAVISDSSIADDAKMTIDIDQVGSTIAGKGLKLIIYYNR